MEFRFFLIVKNECKQGIVVFFYKRTYNKLFYRCNFWSGFTGIGGGGITTPLMLITGLVRNVQAAPTSNAIMIFTAFFASLSFATAKITMADKFVLGYIHIDVAILFFLGSAIFSRFGVNLNQKISLTFRKTVLAVLLLFICIRFVFMLFNN